MKPDAATKALRDRVERSAEKYGSPVVREALRIAISDALDQLERSASARAATAARAYNSTKDLP